MGRFLWTPSDDEVRQLIRDSDQLLPPQGEPEPAKPPELSKPPNPLLINNPVQGQDQGDLRVAGAAPARLLVAPQADLVPAEVGVVRRN